MEKKIVYVCGTTSSGKDKFIKNFTKFLKEKLKNEEYNFVRMDIDDFDENFRAQLVFMLYDIRGSCLEGNMYLDYFIRKKIPFKIILNKIDNIYDWVWYFSNCFLERSIMKQDQNAQNEFFRRILDFTKFFSQTFPIEFKLFKNIFPTSSLSNDGFLDLFMNINCFFVC